VQAEKGYATKNTEFSSFVAGAAASVVGSWMKTGKQPDPD